ncbi:hypothetical protein N8K70_12605 [Microbacterium betulae]|uniref:Uncharacterized protein n=1 Tax=Microbacterium betulae TaxID=2981139 RepID=A0AA97FGG3_9MICO|nr:hypothetical protein [Microbacterium sp. AB]WOF22218.1 hypothetical protein N8K70_12605 [Microbacterium sp. AB]
MTEPEEAARLDDAELLNVLPSRPARRRISLSSPSMVVGTFSLTMSWFTPWVAPLALIAALLAVIALARRHAQRVLAWWGLGLAVAAVLFCGVWALWIVGQLGEAPALELPSLP